MVTKGNIFVETCAYYSTSLLFLLVCLLAVSCVAGLFFLFRLKQIPYRVILGNTTAKGKWVLERRQSFIFGDWESVFETHDKREVQIKAREAMFAYSRLRDFVNERDAEFIHRYEVIDVTVERSRSN